MVPDTVQKSHKTIVCVILIVCVADEKRVLMCKLCGVGFNSAKQAESHYNGHKHKARETELKVASMSVPIGMYQLDHEAAEAYSDDNLHYSCMSFCSYVVIPVFAHYFLGDLLQNV